MKDKAAETTIDYSWLFVTIETQNSVSIQGVSLQHDVC